MIASHLNALDEIVLGYAHLDSVRKLTKTYDKGKIIFMEGEPVDGVRILKHGRAKLFSSTADGRVMTIGIAEPGTALGLAAVVGGGAFETTVEALESCSVDFATLKDVVDHLRRHPEAAWGAAVQLCKSYLNTHRLACTLGSAASVQVRLAKLIVGWVPAQDSNKVKLSLEVDLTHQQISEMIGTTRETVTRALSAFRKQGLVALKGRILLINDLQRLRLLARE